MDEAENTVTGPEVAPPAADAQSFTGDAPDTASETPGSAPADTGEKLYAGKYKSVDDLEAGYKEVERKFHDARRSQPEPVQQGPDTAGYAPAQSVPELDEQSTQAVNYIVEEKLEEHRARDFVTKHAKDLENPLIRGVTKDIIADYRERGDYINQEDALNQAKQLVAEQVKPQVRQAEEEAFESGAALTRTKQLMGAVGETNRSTPPSSDDDLTADDYAKKYKLPRYRG